MINLQLYLYLFHAIQFVMLGARRIASEDHEALIGIRSSIGCQIYYPLEQDGCNTDLNNLDPTEKGCNM